MSVFTEVINVKVSAKDLSRILLLLILSVCITFNSLYIESPVVGLPLSVAFFFVASTGVGEVFFLREGKFVKVALGFATFFALTALFGSFLIISAQFSRFLSLVLVSVIGLVFSVLSLRVKGAHEERSLGPEAREKPRGGMPLYLASGAFVVFVAVAFHALATARTGEGITTVWLTIPNYFLPVFFLCSLLLMFVLFFTRANVGLKFSLILVYSFLAHSLFWIVWYPGRYGDPWMHLGSSRFIDKTGMPYAYSWMLQNFLILDLIKYIGQYAPLILITRMFNVDIYWVHILFVPFLWSFFVPLFSYKLAEMLTKRRSEQFPLIAALVASLIPSLIIWGTVSVPNSVGFIFFLFVIFLMFYWVRTGKRRIWGLSLLVTVAAIFVHPLPAIFALMFFLLVTVFKKFSRVVKVVFYLLLFPLYPYALYLSGAQISLGGLFALESFVSFLSEIVTVMTLFGLLGLVLCVRSRYVDRRNMLLVFAFYVMIIFEYYLSMYGMSGFPFGAHRVLVMADFLLLPFVALSIIEVVNVLAIVFSSVNLSTSFLKSIKAKFFSYGMFPRYLGFTLICLVLSVQASSALYQAYPHNEIVNIQPAVYMMEAVYYINSTAPGPYVVLCDTQLANIAIGLLGIDYGYPGGGWGVFGIPEFWYPTIEMYGEMKSSPSFHVMQRALELVEWVEVAYFVVSVMAGESFESAVEETSAILPIEAVFGGGKLYVFRYPIPVVEGVGPSLKVVFDDGQSSEVPTTFSYMHRSDVSYRVSLSGHSSYNISGYPNHWIFSNLTVDGISRPFDESSDLNGFIFVSALDSSSVLNVSWRANDLYPNVGWKEVSFKSGWQTHPTYTGTIRPNISTDGNVLEMSWNFTSDLYQYYYYVKPCNVSTDDYQYVTVRWKSTGPIAVVGVYFEEGSLDIVPLSSQSSGWTTTIKQLPPGKNITMVLVGITNIKNKEIRGVYSLQVDYILISG